MSASPFSNHSSVRLGNPRSRRPRGDVRTCGIRRFAVQIGLIKNCGRDSLRGDVMLEPNETDYSCEECGADVSEDDDFCTNCGVIFKADVVCRNHAAQPAKGVCLICHDPYCEECGITIDQMFFCRRHGEYEIYERSACVFDSTENRDAQIAFQILKKEGLHPFLVPRAIGPVTNIGRLTPNTSVGPHLVLVPFQEVQTAEEKLKELRTSR